MKDSNITKEKIVGLIEKHIYYKDYLKTHYLSDKPVSSLNFLVFWFLNLEKKNLLPHNCLFINGQLSETVLQGIHNILEELQYPYESLIPEDIIFHNQYYVDRIDTKKPFLVKGYATQNYYYHNKIVTEYLNYKIKHSLPVVLHFEGDIMQLSNDLFFTNTIRHYCYPIELQLPVSKKKGYEKDLLKHLNKAGK